MALKITEDCIACGTCVDTCPVGAIVEAGDKYAINEDCTECRACESSCPVNAITD
jgi:NAD-dependent dihydropyrimidine dehydrogenase PreA subunit